MILIKQTLKIQIEIQMIWNENNGYLVIKKINTFNLFL